MLKIRRVLVGVSGGVDSAVTALLLKNRGFDVHGVFMQNWDIADEKGQCSADKDYKDASIVCDKLKIPLHYVNFVKSYWNNVFTDLLNDYQSGFTPNPDILCNRHIKFDEFVKYALEKMGADAIATGHYCKTSFGPFLENYQPNTKVKLLKAENINKDQTFFLSQVQEEHLRKVMFPLGDKMKSEVKEIALEHGLTRVATKKESMGICFIGTRNFQTFISEYIENRKGPFVDIDTNQIVGEHNGIHQWTIGQRSRLQNYRNCSYIIRKDAKTNTLYIAAGWNHPGLFSDIFFTSPPHWIHSEPVELQSGVLQCDFKFQHVEALRKCTICSTKNGLIVNLPTTLRALTPGQYAVFYKGNECLGSARIVNSGPQRFFYLNYRRKSRKREEKIVVNHTEVIEDFTECQKVYNS